MLSVNLADYRLLCSTLEELRKKFELQKTRITLLLEDTVKQKVRLQKILGKSNDLTRRLTVLQRKQLGMLYEPGRHIPFSNDIPVLNRQFPELDHKFLRNPDAPETYKNMKDLRAGEIRVISMIDETREKLLRLELLEMRMRELLVSINRALAVYEAQWQRIRRMIYPLGVFSIFIKNLRQFFGFSHFSPRDLNDIKFLGDLAGSIMKMADSPVF